jgi:acyl-coenzyme A thioesterase PaaI-like protein
MTDLSSPETAVPNRLGVTARYERGELIFDLAPRPHALHHGVVRASVLSFVVDIAAGVPIDDDPDAWALTTDMTVRMRPVPAPACISAVNRIVRRGSRSVTSIVELTTATGEPIATGAIGFTRVTRKATDPPKPAVTPERIVELFRGLPALARPLREEAGIEVVDADAGVVEVPVTPEIQNPAGTLQGAMVALVAEAAAEDLVASRFGSPVVVTDLDLRYLARTQDGPVRTRTRLLGAGPDAAIEVELIDTATDTLTTLVYARTAPAPPNGSAS